MRQRLGNGIGIASVLAIALGCDPPAAGPPDAGASATPSLGASAGAVGPAPSTTAEEPRGDGARGRDLVAKHECQRCHEGADLEGVPRIANERHCTRCHLDVMQNKFAGKPDNERWKKNVAHLTGVPTLTGVGKRLRYEWLVAFLVEPHDQRPRLVPTMPRLGLSRQDARDIATFLVDRAQPAKVEASVALTPPDAVELARGRALYETTGCGDCHDFGGVPALRTELKPADDPAVVRAETRPIVMMAVDLRHARERLQPEALEGWILAPRSLKADTLMPETAMTGDEARSIARYVMYAPLAAKPARAVPASLPLLERRVTFGEVAERVLNVTCRHCHGDPDAALGDGGPGNTGGFGFKAKGINFTSYEHTLGGYLDERGERQSLFAKIPDGTPRLLASLQARHAEEAGRPHAEVRGMPLGLPALGPEEIQLVASWIAQGRPR
jgi:cytochrome c1